MNALLRSALVLAGVAFASQASAQITFYEQEGYDGRSFTTEEQVGNFKRIGFNDRASSVVVERDWWQVCEDELFGGRCVVLRPGRYPSLAAMGLNDRISSVRAMSGMGGGNPRSEANPYLPGPVAPYDYRRRSFERTFEANVTSVRAVVGPPEQRCWVEREQVVQSRSNVGGAIFGALIGGILGHQVGSGTGQDIATAGGAVAGAALGANADGGGQRVSSRDVQHCSESPRYARPEYWDVTYTFRGREHRVQVTTPPGPTITVNEQGEPRE